MLITEKTKIADLIKHHPDALETIVQLSPDFKKLRNPVIRALMAKRTSIAMASKVGGCRPADFFKALEPLGFEYDLTVSDEDSFESSTLISSPKPPGLQNKLIVSMDVRSMLAEGKDPLKAIQQKSKSLKLDEALLIINNFEPVPLIKLLEKQGYSTFVDTIHPELVETYFYWKSTEDQASLDLEKVASPETDSDSWENVFERYQNVLEEIDVRELEMPLPMIRILERLDTLSPDKALFVRHKKVPVFLLSELKDKAYSYQIKEVSDQEVLILIYKI